jgi:hypothetical protein
MRDRPGDGDDADEGSEIANGVHPRAAPLVDRSPARPSPQGKALRYGPGQLRHSQRSVARRAPKLRFQLWSDDGFLARTDCEVGEVGLAADVDEQTDGTGSGCRHGLGHAQRLGPVDQDVEVGVVDVDLQVGPFVRADVGACFLAAVGIHLSEPVERPVGVGEVLDRALVSGVGWVGLASIEGA